ncbi:MAG: protein-lysine N-methyltransferase [Parcubacteria group bacterium]|nr:protein-lysine N-methyltransferase [Parcubacteria group bacterium]
MTRNIYVKESSIEGRGIFASRNFKRGEIIFILKGKLKKWHVKDKSTAQEGPNWVGVGKDTWIDPAYPFLYMNHSCNPNMGIKGRVTFVALRNIKKGEEVTIDYSITEETLLWEMENGEKKSVPGFRPVVRSIQHIPLATYKKYLPYVPTYFQRVYNSYHQLKKHG